MLRLATQLLVGDQGKRSAEMFVLDDRGLRDLSNFVEGSIRQFDPAIADRQPAVGIIDDGDPLADRRLRLLAWLPAEPASQLLEAALLGTLVGKFAVENICAS